MATTRPLLALTIFRSFHSSSYESSWLTSALALTKSLKSCVASVRFSPSRCSICLATEKSNALALSAAGEKLTVSNTITGYNNRKSSAFALVSSFCSRMRSAMSVQQLPTSSMRFRIFTGKLAELSKGR